VQPVEIAKALGSVMDDKRQVGVNTVYAPTSYTVRISSADAEEMGAFRATLAGELSTYLVARAGEQQYHLATKPTVSIEVDEKLKLGRFKVAAEMAAPPSKPAPGAPATSPAPPSAKPAGDPSLTDEIAALGWDEEPEADDSPETRDAHDFATVTVSGIQHDVALKGDRFEIGRLAECGICLQDANVSRRHAAFIRDETGWSIEDLGSTNGTRRNDEPTTHARLKDGDTIQVGVTELVFHEPRM
jgi:predicted component of type VI protein secretion system